MYVGKQELLVPVFHGQNLPQDVGVPALGTAGNVVAGIGDESRLSLKGQRHFQCLVRSSGQAGVVELTAFVPDVDSQPVGGFLCIGQVGFGLGHHNDAAASHRRVMADVTHMPAHTADMGILFQLVHILVDGSHWLVTGNALLAAQDQGQLAVYRVDVLAVFHKVAQHGGYLAHGGNAVGVG